MSTSSIHRHMVDLIKELGIGVLLCCLGLCSRASGQTITSVTAADGGPIIAQNTFVVITGTNLVPGDTPRGGVIWSTAPSFASGLMPTQLGGVSVTVDNNPAFVYFYCSAATDPQCSQDQINILTPLDNAIGPAPIVVTSGTNSSPAFSAILQAVAPSFLLFDAAGHIAATHADNTLLGPASLYPGSSTPATAGEEIQLFAVGFGLPASPLVDGSATQSGSLPVLPGCQVGGVRAGLAFAGLNGPGLYQLNLTIPTTAANGDNTVSCDYNGAPTPVGDVITVSSNTPSPILNVTTSGAGGGTVASSPPATSCGSGCLSFPAGTVITLTATPNSGSAFAGWSGACSGTAQCTVTMISSQAVVAAFKLAPAAQQTLLVGAYESGGTCDSGNPNWTESGAFSIVTQPSLSSLAASGGSFTGVWNAVPTGGVKCIGTLPPNPNSNTGTASGVVHPGGATTITLGGGAPSCVPTGSGTTTSISGILPAACLVGSNGRSTGSGTFQVSALPGELGAVLTIVTAGSGSGAVDSSPPGTSCGSGCLAFAAGTAVTLTARANSGSTFAGWSGACSGTAQCTVTMTSSQVVTATFIVTALIPAVSIGPTSLNIVLPENAPQSFVITNTGAPGSIMDYYVTDPTGYLNIQNPGGSSGTLAGTLGGGQSAQIKISVQPQFATVPDDPCDVLGYLVGTTKGVTVLTPQASNYVKIPVSVNILEEFDVSVSVCYFEMGGSVCNPGGIMLGVALVTQWGTTNASANDAATFFIQASGTPGDSYSVVISSGQPAGAYCSVVSGGSGTFGSSMATAVINCSE